MARVFCYPGLMSKINRIESFGNAMRVRTDDGKTYTAQPTGHGWWQLPPLDLSADGTTPPDTGGGTTPPDTGGGSTGGGGGVTVPASFTVKAVNGTPYNLNTKQLNHAADILRACVKRANANNRKVMVIVLITAIVESVLYMYSNTSHYPETANIPHDLNGRDSDSVGLFQQRPAAGWGTPAQCMNTEYSVNAFLGDAAPRGLFEVPDWQNDSPGRAAQRVQVSAFPTRYDNVVPVAEAIIDKAITK
jgi:hypothetical protein